MKKVKKLLVVLFTLSFILALVSCGATVCTECVDGDGNGLCDNCDKEMPKTETNDIVLFEDEEPTFQIILAKGISNEVKQAVNTGIKAVLRNTKNISLDVFTEGDKSESETEIEILVGNVTSRGDKYTFDAHVLGKEGYAIRIVDNKILINAGSDEKLVEIINKFATDVILKDDMSSIVMTADDCIEKKQTGYKITSVKVNGNDMNGYTIAADLANPDHKAIAVEIQDTFYSRAGYWFEIVDIKDATEKSFVIKSIPKTTGTDNYKIYADGTQLVIECAYDNVISMTTNAYLRDNFLLASGEVNFEGTLYTKDISVLYYEDFGAKGDGETDDFKAMYNTHVMANKGGQTVLGTPGAEYYIFNTRMTVDGKETPVSIPIRTTTNWQGAKIIIDDTNISLHSTNSDLARYDIFHILPDEEHEKFTFKDNKFKDQTVLDAIVSDGLNPDTKKINFKVDGWDGSLLIVPVNNEHRVFRRRGYGSHAGAEMHEIIKIDKDGNVSEETPIMFEYTNLNYILVYKLDPETAITVGNATIETRDPQINHLVDGEFIGGYTQRGINVYRSYTTVHDINHVVIEGFTLKDRANGKVGPSANGMFEATNADHVTFENCIIPGRQSYGGSSYNFRATNVNKIVLKNCTQSNFWVTVNYDTGIMTPGTDYVVGALPSTSSVTIKNDAGESKSFGMHWGIGGTNYCKNMEYIGSQISRFDAHAGLYNGKIIDTKINGMELTGVGDLIIENVDWYQYGTSTPFLYLRADYGYHWDGDIMIKDTRAHLYDELDGSPTLRLAHYNYTNWYYGYTCAFPNITLDNFDLYYTKAGTPIQSFNIELMGSFKANMHLSGDVGTTSIFGYTDNNGDGYIDEPLFDVNLDGKIDENDRVDLDGNGVVGETKMKMDDPSTWGSKSQASGYDVNDGIHHPNSNVNLNPVKPPTYFKVINNDGVNGGGYYTYNIPNTAGCSDGHWYMEEGDEDTMGGFFGRTKFIYENDDGEEEYFLGTDHKNQRKTKTFKFGQ